MWVWRWDPEGLGVGGKTGVMSNKMGGCCLGGVVLFKSSSQKIFQDNYLVWMLSE